MALFWKAAAIVILTVIFSAALSKTEKDVAVVLTASASCIIAVLAIQTLTDVISFLRNLGNASNSAIPFLDTLLRIAGVALITELTGLISADAGSSSLAKAMNLLGNAVILSISLPIFETFLEIIQEILNIL